MKPVLSLLWLLFLIYVVVATTIKQFEPPPEPYYSETTEQTDR